MRFRSWAVVAILACLAFPILAASVGRDFKFGVQMARDGIWREATFRWRKVEKATAPNAHLLNNLGVAYEKTGEYEAARDAYERALELSPDDPAIQSNHDQFMSFYDEFVAGRDASDAGRNADAGR